MEKKPANKAPWWMYLIAVVVVSVLLAMAYILSSPQLMRTLFL